MALPVSAEPGVRDFCSKLVQTRLLSRMPRPGKEIGQRLRIGPFPVSLSLGGQALVGGQLILGKAKDGNLTITSGSHLLPEVMRGLRSQLLDPGPLATDGDDNLVWSYGDEYQQLLGVQVENVEFVVEAVVAAFASAAGVDVGRLRGHIWVQQCEVARDYDCPGAEGLVREIADRAIVGAGQIRVRSFVSRAKNQIVVSWHDGNAAPAERKLYAKCHDRIRAEVSLRSRQAVVRLLRRSGNGAAWVHSLSGAHVAAEAAAVACAAAPLLDEMETVAREATEVPPRSGVDLLIALAPLLRLAAPPPHAQGTPGRPRGAGVGHLARRVVDHLVFDGIFDARGMHQSAAVVLALQEMKAAGALRSTAARPRCFSVHPSHETARQALAGARQEPACVDAAQPEEPGCSEDGLTEPTP